MELRELSMKKILLLAMVLFVSQITCDAKDYAKMHLKQMKKNQEYRINNTYFTESKAPVNKVASLKDPQLIKLSGYEDISSADLKSKLAKDNAEYQKVSKYLASKKINEYYMQAYSEDFYRVYRIAEKIIRANGLDFINWRLTISASNEFNAYNSDTNNVTVHAGLLDSFANNDDALALAMGHEFAHGLLGHAKRKAKYIAKINRAKRMLNYTAYNIALKRYNKVSRDMEYEADIEGAKLIAKAGYDLSKAKDVLAILNTMSYADEINQTHPDNEKRLANYEQNKNMFIESEFRKQGLYNIYNSEVLNCEKSSNRNSIVLTGGKRSNKQNYYQPESPLDMYLRYGYKSYLVGEADDAIKYFKDYLKYDKTNYAVYLYLSYAYEYLYQTKNKESDLKSAKEFADYAKKLAPNNKYVKDQILAL